MLKSSVILFRSILVLQLLDLLMGEPQTPHFYDFRIFGRVPGSPNQLFSSLETPGYLKKLKKIPGTFKKYHFCKSQKLWTYTNFTMFEKSGADKSRRFVYEHLETIGSEINI